MTLQTGILRRAVAGSAVAAALISGFGVATAFACTGAECEKTDPATPNAEAAGPPTMNADQVLMMIDQDYDTGAGGGQISGLIHSVLKLRAQGFKPSKGNTDAIVKA